MIYSEDVGLDAWQRTLAPYGKRMSEETYRSLIGTTQKHSIEHVITQMGVAPSMKIWTGTFWAALVDLVDRGVRPMPGVHELIAHLRRRGPSAGRRLQQRHRLRAQGADPNRVAACCSIASSGSIRSPTANPHPICTCSVARSLGVLAEMCLAVEDSPSGVQAATDGRDDMRPDAQSGSGTRRAIAEHTSSSLRLSDLDQNLGRSPFDLAADNGVPSHDEHGPPGAGC